MGTVPAATRQRRVPGPLGLRVRNQVVRSMLSARLIAATCLILLSAAAPDLEGLPGVHQAVGAAQKRVSLGHEPQKSPRANPFEHNSEDEDDDASEHTDGLLKKMEDAAYDESDEE